MHRACVKMTSRVGKHEISYMDGLSDQLNNSNIGGNFGSGQLVNHISYADDMCLLASLQLVCRNY